jgi:hypothetical protein
MNTVDYEVIQQHDGLSVLVAIHDGKRYADDPRPVRVWTFRELLDVHRHEFAGTKFGRAWFVPIVGNRMEITPIGLVK